MNIEPVDPGVNRFRYLFDIAVFLIVTTILQWGAAAFFKPDSFQSELSFGLVDKALLFAFAWLLIHLRGERLEDIGLKSPASWAQALIVGSAYAGIAFVLIYISEKAGIHRNLSAFREVHGNIEFTLFGIFFSFIGAGFYEEFIYRGFFFQGLALLFGGSRQAWLGACLVQGAVFGADHAYQGSIGIVITGLLGMTMGFIFLAQGRNLWPVIIGHGLYDAGRFALFYFQGPPVG